MEQGGISGAVSCKWAKGTGGPAGDEFYNLVATETVGTLCSDTHPGSYSGQDAYTGRLVAMKAKEKQVGFNWHNGGGYGNAHDGLGITIDGSPPLNCSKAPAVTLPTMAVRRLTPRETNRLQAFPDDWNAEGIDKQGRRIAMADSPRYRQMGNAVTVNVAQAIAERVRSILTE